MPSYTTVPTPKVRSYRAFILELSEMFKADDLKRLKFALKDDIKAGPMEGLRTSLDVFSALEGYDLLGPEKLGVLREYLETIDRPAMVYMLDEYDDADTTFPLKPRSDNRLEKDGYSVSVENGRHFDTAGGEFVEVRSGANYSLVLVNKNNHRGTIHVKVDGYDMFPDGFRFGPKQTHTIERPSKEQKKFKFFAIHDAPLRSGINKWRKNENGVIQVKFSPEKADMKINCVANGFGCQVSCSTEIIDTQFIEMVSEIFGNGRNAPVTVTISPWKPLAQRGLKLVEYGVGDGSRVNVNVGLPGGISPQCFGYTKKIDASSKNNIKWRAGATTLEDASDQEFGKVKGFPLDPSQAVTLNLRLVARENEIPIPSTGDPTPLTKATLIPPPVPN